MLGLSVHTPVVPLEREMRLASLQAVLPPLAREAGYGLNLPERLAGRPVVFSFASKVGAMERIAGLARVLGLEITLNADGRTLDVARDPRTVTVSLEARIGIALAEYRSLAAPLLERNPRERYEEAVRLYRLSDEAIRAREFERCYELGRRSDQVSGLATSTGEAIARTLLIAGDPKVFARRNSRENAVTIPPSAVSGLKEYLAGRGVSQFDYPNMGDVLQGRPPLVDQKPFATESRQQGAALGEGSPILELRHASSDSGEMWFGLRGTTPWRSRLVDSIALMLPPAGERRDPGLADDVPGADVPFKPEMPFRFHRFVSLSTAGSAAIPAGLDHASWFRTDKRQGYEFEEGTVRSWFERESPLPIRIRRDGTWLVVEDLEGSWPEFSIDRRPFDKAKTIVEGKPPTPGTLQEWLDGVRERDLDSLENLLPEIPEWDVRYTGVTSGVRLLRSALREAGGKSFDKPIGELNPAARSDAKRFFRGAYVWEYFPWLAHPNNAAPLDQMRLIATRAKGMFRTRIALPKGVRPPPGLNEAIFTVPMGPGK